MTVGLLVLELISVFFLTLFLLHHYGNIKKQHPLVTSATLIAWYFSLIIIFILPLDVSSTYYRQCKSLNPGDRDGIGNTASEISANSSQIDLTKNTLKVALKNNSGYVYCKKPFTYVPHSTLPIMWRIVYWSSQCLTWVILPFMQSYTCSGHFSTLGKLKHALVQNAVYYGTYLLIFVLLIIYVAASPNITLDISRLKVIGITASNTWGLFLLILLLGYGLVEVPRSLWRAASISLTMAYTQFKLAKLSTEKQEASETMEDILREVERISETIRYNHPLRKSVNTIIRKCPKEFQDKVGQGMDDYIEYDDKQQRCESVCEKTLVRLHSRIIQSVQRTKRISIQWNILMKKAIYLDSIRENSNQTRRVWTDKQSKEKQSNPCTAKLKWYWECKVRFVFLRVVAVCLTILSFMVIWSECTFFNKSPVLSLFAIFINLAKKNHSYFYIEMASCAIMSYLCISAYYTIFRIKFFNIYYIAGHHQTNESSLMFIGIMLCRLTPPMCLNFLGLIHLDAHIAGDVDVETSYTGIMGHLDVIPIISRGFNIYFPMLLVFLCIATYVSLCRRCLSWLGFQQFIDGQSGDDFTADLVNEGRQLVERELRLLERESKRTGHTGAVTSRRILSRTWQGRMMKDAERTSAPRTDDKLELLADQEPLGYSSTAADWEPDGPFTDESGAQFCGSLQRSMLGTTSRRPPKSIFDDV